jgi:hypothetical protein
MTRLLPTFDAALIINPNDVKSAAGSEIRSWPAPRSWVAKSVIASRPNVASNTKVSLEPAADRPQSKRIAAMRPSLLPFSARCGKSTPPQRVQRNEMSIFSGNNFQDRQTAAANARRAQAEKFLAKTKYDPSDPAVIEREAKRRAVLEARELRAAQRQAQKEAAEAELALKLAAEQRAREEALKAEAIAREIAHVEKLAREAALEAERKLERDARYAARKARKSQRKSEIQRYR